MSICYAKRRKNRASYIGNTSLLYPVKSHHSFYRYNQNPPSHSSLQQKCYCQYGSNYVYTINLDGWAGPVEGPSIITGKYLIVPMMWPIGIKCNGYAFPDAKSEIWRPICFKPVYFIELKTLNGKSFSKVSNMHAASVLVYNYLGLHGIPAFGLNNLEANLF